MEKHGRGRLTRLAKVKQSRASCSSCRGVGYLMFRLGPLLYSLVQLYQLWRAPGWKVGGVRELCVYVHQGPALH